MKNLFKTFLAMSLVLLVLFSAGCSKEEEKKPAVGDYISVNAAMEYLKAIYKPSDEATPTPSDYERHALIRVGGEAFDVVWTTDLGEDMIKVVPGENDKVVIDINEKCESDTPYTLTATITDRGGNSLSQSWIHILPEAFDGGQVLKEAYALGKGECLPYETTLTGAVTAINTMYNPEYQNITVTMEVDGYDQYPIMCYRMKGANVENLQIGNIITVTGTIKNYNGTIEFDYGCMMEKCEEGNAVEAPENSVDILTQAYALSAGDNLPYLATLTGKIIEIQTPYNPDYRNVSVVIEIEGAQQYPLLCYRLKGTDAEFLQVGDVITVTGMIKNYKGTIEFDAGCTLID